MRPGRTLHSIRCLLDEQNSQYSVGSAENSFERLGRFACRSLSGSNWNEHFHSERVHFLPANVANSGLRVTRDTSQKPFSMGSCVDLDAIVRCAERRSMPGSTKLESLASSSLLLSIGFDGPIFDGNEPWPSMEMACRLFALLHWDLHGDEPLVG